MVRARCLVAEGHGRFLAEEQRAVAGQPVEPPVEVLGLHRQVLGRVIVGGRRHLLAVGADDDLGIVAPGGGGVLAVHLRQVAIRPGTSSMTFSARSGSSVTSQTGEL
jgi:hypothetical protein